MQTWTSTRLGVRIVKKMVRYIITENLWYNQKQDGRIMDTFLKEIHSFKKNFMQVCQKDFQRSQVLH